MNNSERASAGIPQLAVYFSWAYPAVQVSSADPHIIALHDAILQMQGAERSFFQFGGYVYFDDKCEVLATTSVSPMALGTSLIFGGPNQLPKDVSDVLTRQGRFQEITLEVLARKGATHFAWIRPNELQVAV